MPNTAHEAPVPAGARERIGAPSPVEAWHPLSPPPSPNRHPLRFLRWVAGVHRDTLEDNPIYRKTARVRYVRRPRRLPLLARDLLAGLFFGAIALFAVLVLRKLDERPIPPQVLRYYIAAVGAVYLVALCIGGATLGFRAGTFIKATDKAMAWDDLAMTPLREEHFLWAWLWSPLIDRSRGFVLAVIFGTFGLLNLPQFPTFVEQDTPVLLAALMGMFVSVLLLAILGVLASSGIATLSMIQSLDLGPRLYDAAHVLWGLFHLIPLASGLLCELAAGAFVISGMVDGAGWFYVSSLFSVVGICLTAASDWMLVHFLLPDFWSAILARSAVRYQKSWWRALMGK